MSPDPPVNHQGTAAAGARDARPAAAAATGGGGVGEFFAALGTAWRLTRLSEPGSSPPWRPRWTRAGRRRRWHRSPGRTPRACGTRTRCWPPGCRPPSCLCRERDRRGRRGAASAIRQRGCSIITATRRAHARAARHRGPGKPLRQSISRPTLLQLRSIAVATRYYARNATQTRASPGYAAARVVNSPGSRWPCTIQPAHGACMHDRLRWNVPWDMWVFEQHHPEKARRSRED